jgi:hypothetical protein
MGMLGTNESSVTYPIFFNNPSTGQLYFTFRFGSSGGGNQFFYAYNAGTTTWVAAAGTATAGLLVQGIGVTPSNNAYFNGQPKWDPVTGKLWWSWEYNNNQNGTGEPAYQFLAQWNGTTFKDINGSVITIPQTWNNSVPVYGDGSTSTHYSSLQEFDVYNGIFYIGVTHDDTNAITQSYVITNFGGTFAERVLTTWMANPSPNCVFGFCSIGVAPAFVGQQIFLVLADADNVSGHTIAMTSNDGFNTDKRTYVIMNHSNPNWEMVKDSTDTRTGLLSFIWMDADDTQGGYTYTFTTTAGSLFALDWTPPE